MSEAVHFVLKKGNIAVALKTGISVYRRKITKDTDDEVGSVVMI